MVRIIWGFFFIAAGFVLVCEQYFGYSFVSGTQQIFGKFDQFFINQAIHGFLIRLIFAVALFAIGTALIESGQRYVFSKIRSANNSEQSDPRDGWEI